MTVRLRSNTGEVYFLTRAIHADERRPIAFDELRALRFLSQLAFEPSNLYALRRFAYEDLLSSREPLGDQQLFHQIAQRLHLGHLVLLRDEEVREARTTVHVGGEEAEAEEAEEPTQVEEEPKIKDWKIECAHHTANGRDLFEKGNRMALVPDVGKTKDTLKIHWRDDWQASMPGSLEVRTPGRANGTADQSGGSGHFTTYGLEAEYLGDIDIFNIVSPWFWRSFKEKTTHTVQPGPTTITVDVYNPRQFKFEFAFPPMAGLKDGHKYEAEGSKQVKGLVKGETDLKHTYETEDAYWSPSSLTLDTSRTSTDPSPDFKPSESDQKFADTIKLTRDGGNVSLDILTLAGAILNYADTVRGIVKMVKDYAPKVGWYIDWNLQLMQGAMAVEWYWKEHTDHRVFQYIDFNIALTLFSLTFEIGIGVSACSFKLQIYAQLSGELKLEAGAKRDAPEGAPGFTLPAVKGKIGGALGARAEAGYIFKFEAKGETAIETECALGVNQRNSAVSFDARMRWTGIECTATFSTGFLGISHTKTKKLTLVGASPWWGLTWPKEEPYSPPVISRDRVQAAVKKVLTAGWNVRVYDGDTWIETDTVASLITDRIERDSAFDKTDKMVDALTNQIRQDLNVIGRRSMRRDYVELSDLRSYLNGSSHGRSLATHLAAAASPTRALAAANA